MSEVYVSINIVSDRFRNPQIVYLSIDIIELSLHSYKRNSQNKAGINYSFSLSFLKCLRYSRISAI